MLKYFTPIFTLFLTSNLLLSAVTPYEGPFVSWGADGRVIIHEDRMKREPETGAQYATAPFRTVGEMHIQDGMPFKYAAVPGIPQAVHTTGEEESLVTEAPFQAISIDEVTTPPHFSCGRLEMFFTVPDKAYPKIFYGSASAIGQNLLITAAHNFLPEFFEGEYNIKHRAHIVNFEHQLVDGHLKYVHRLPVETHCYLHPEWVKSFNQGFDIAFVFLTDPITLTPTEREHLLKLQIANNDTQVEVIGYPHGKPIMHKTIGKTQNDSHVSPIIYHSANTHPGNSGSPIVKDKEELVGVHTRGADATGLNSGVRIRPDIMDFMEKCVQAHQKFIEEKEAAKKRDEDLKQPSADVLLAKAEGELNAKIEVVKSMLEDKMPMKSIVKYSGLQQEQIEKIQASLAAVE